MYGLRREEERELHRLANYNHQQLVDALTLPLLCKGKHFSLSINITTYKNAAVTSATSKGIWLGMLLAHLKCSPRQNLTARIDALNMIVLQSIHRHLHQTTNCSISSDLYCNQLVRLPHILSQNCARCGPVQSPHDIADLTLHRDLAEFMGPLLKGPTASVQQARLFHFNKIFFRPFLTPCKGTFFMIRAPNAVLTILFDLIWKRFYANSIHTRPINGHDVIYYDDDLCPVLYATRSEIPVFWNALKSSEEFPLSKINDSSQSLLLFLYLALVP